MADGDVVPSTPPTIGPTDEQSFQVVEAIATGLDSGAVHGDGVVGPRALSPMLTDDAAVLTRASSGNDREIARRFAAEGQVRASRWWSTTG